MEKQCTKCKEIKPLEEFGKRSGTADGLKYECKTCCKTAAKTYSQSNKFKTRIKNYMKNYMQTYSKTPVYKQKKRTKRREVKLWLLQELGTNKCSRCPEDTLVCLDFHHLGNKTFDIGAGNTMFTKSKEKLLKEAKKCIVLCANCHRKEHSCT